MLPNAQDLILRVYKTCKKESERGCLVYSVAKFVKRTCCMLGIKKQTLQRIVSKCDKTSPSTSDIDNKVFRMEYQDYMEKIRSPNTRIFLT